ncbi:MAG: YqaA family protein [Halobacteriota archaeon]
MPLITTYVLLELFVVAATSSVLPIPTEPTIALLLSANMSSLIILTVLVPASVLGASVGYLLGKYGVQRVIPFHNSARERRIKDWFNKYGAPLLLVSPWMPFVGDLVPIAAGVENFKPSAFLAIMFVAKTIKGAAIVYFLSFFIQLLNLHL